MPLHIIKASDPLTVETITLTVYSPPSYGKTSLGFTAEKPLLLSFDNGAYRAENRGDSVSIAKWADVDSLSREDLEPYHTIVVDTAGRALDIMSDAIIASNPKMGRGSGALSLQGFGELKTKFARWMSLLRSYGKDIVLICHATEEKDGDDMVERIDAQGASRNEIYKSSDAMCRIELDAAGRRWLDFDPRTKGFGKNPGRLPRIEFVHPSKNPHTLAEVITATKKAINKITVDQADAVSEAEAWLAAIAGAKMLEEFNVLVKLAREARERGEKSAHSKAITLGVEAKKRGYRANKSTGQYEQAVAEAINES